MADCIITLNGTELEVDYDYFPADHSVGWGEDIEITRVALEGGAKVVLSIHDQQAVERAVLKYERAARREHASRCIHAGIHNSLLSAYREIRGVRQ